MNAIVQLLRFIREQHLVGTDPAEIVRQMWGRFGLVVQPLTVQNAQRAIRDEMRYMEERGRAKYLPRDRRA